jgi:hypothetical protein
MEFRSSVPADEMVGYRRSESGFDSATRRQEEHMMRYRQGVEGLEKIASGGI